MLLLNAKGRNYFKILTIECGTRRNFFRQPQRQQDDKNEVDTFDPVKPCLDKIHFGMCLDFCR